MRLAVYNSSVDQHFENCTSRVNPLNLCTVSVPRKILIFHEKVNDLLSSKQIHSFSVCMRILCMILYEQLTSDITDLSVVKR